MKKINLFFFAILFTAIGNYGQSIYVAESLTESGEAVGANNVWDIDPWGRSLFIVYDNLTPITDNIIYLFVDKFIDGSFQPFDSKVVEIDKPTSRIKYDYKFTDVGKFRVYAVNANEETLSSLLLTLNIKTGSSSKASHSDNYYDGIGLIYCEKILVGGTTLDVIKKASISKNKGWIYIKLSHYAQLNSGTIQVDFWRKENNSFDYDQYIESKKYKIDPTWADTFFKYQFANPGKYKIVIYNDFETVIKTGFITVTN